MTQEWSMITICQLFSINSKRQITSEKCTHNNIFQMAPLLRFLVLEIFVHKTHFRLGNSGGKGIQSYFKKKYNFCAEFHPIRTNITGM